MDMAAGVAGVGVYTGPAGGVVVDNAGTINGAVGSAVLRSTADLLIVKAGAAFNGAILGGGGTMDLLGGKGVISGLSGAAGKISGTDSARFAGFGTYALDISSVWDIAGTNTIRVGQGLLGNYPPPILPPLPVR